jgi:hypothetical protein
MKDLTWIKGSGRTQSQSSKFCRQLLLEHGGLVGLGNSLRAVIARQK